MRIGIALFYVCIVGLFFSVAFPGLRAQEELKSFKFSMVTEAGDVKTTSHCFFKEGKFRVETEGAGATSIVIYSGTNAYTYFPANNFNSLKDAEFFIELAFLVIICIFSLV